MLLFLSNQYKNKRMGGLCKGFSTFNSLLLNIKTVLKHWNSPVKELVLFGMQWILFKSSFPSVQNAFKQRAQPSMSAAPLCL